MDLFFNLGVVFPSKQSLFAYGHFLSENPNFLRFVDETESGTMHRERASEQKNQEALLFHIALTNLLDISIFLFVPEERDTYIDILDYIHNEKVLNKMALILRGLRGLLMVNPEACSYGGEALISALYDFLNSAVNSNDQDTAALRSDISVLGITPEDVFSELAVNFENEGRTDALYTAFGEITAIMADFYGNVSSLNNNFATSKFKLGVPYICFSFFAMYQEITTMYAEGTLDLPEGLKDDPDESFWEETTTTDD
jgi:hypothetical protein